MRQYLVFQLAGPMASWGDIAIGENRPTLRGPTRSGIVGMLAGAFRICRDDAEGMTALGDAVGVATLSLSIGTIARDYHTSQVPPAVALKGAGTVTRRDELLALARYNREKGASADTILSTREYLCDAAWLVAVWARMVEVYSLEAVQQALRSPGFVPYLGRKSCPTMLPLRPSILTAETICAAFNLWWIQRPELSVSVLQRTDSEGRGLPIEWDADGEAGVPERSRTLRRDAPGDRKRWQFVNRPVCQGECALGETP